MKTILIAVSTTAGTVLLTLFGGVDVAFQLLLMIMFVDLITGLMVAGIFKRSTKTVGGAISSNIGFKGLCKKSLILMFVIVGTYLDRMLNINQARMIVIIFFMTNEFLSVVENAGIMGVPVPKKIMNMFEVLRKGSETNEIDSIK